MGSDSWGARPYSRRRVLAAGLGAGALLTAARLPGVRHVTRPGVGVGVRPRPHLPEGADTIPQIEHVIVVMMENHSFDNYLGVLGRGDGLPVDKHGNPTAVNLDANGRPVRSFRMPGFTQLRTEPSNGWNAGHIAMNGHRNDGFVRASGAVAMGYWTPQDLPFYAALARTFVLADRWFSSVAAKTFPNRAFLLAATSGGIITNVLPPTPPNGTIMDRLDAHGISWKNYSSTLGTALLFASGRNSPQKVVPIAEFYTDAAAGRLPFFSVVDTDFDKGSEENPQDIRVGEAFAAGVINAALQGPNWDKTLLVWCYDEAGGYYDHVSPPSAPAPDATPPDIHVPPDQPGGFDRYGFRVPAVVVSPRARKGHVSHVVYDHTSILRFIETKWNLPALTARDAHAANLLDCLDLRGRPAFLHPPTLPAPTMPPAQPAPPLDQSAIPVGAPTGPP